MDIQWDGIGATGDSVVPPKNRVGPARPCAKPSPLALRRVLVVGIATGELSKRALRSPTTGTHFPTLRAMQLPLLSCGLLAMLAVQATATALTYKLNANEKACFYTMTQTQNEKIAFYFAVRAPDPRWPLRPLRARMDAAGCLRCRRRCKRAVLSISTM